MARKQASGGKVKELGPRLYQIEASSGNNPITGERFHGTKTEANARLAELKQELQLARDLLEVGVTGDDLNECGFSVARFVADGQTNAVMAKRMVEDAREKRRGAITYAELSDELLTHLEKYGKSKKTGKPLTQKTLGDYRITEGHITSSFIGNLAINEVTGDDVLRFLDEARDGGMGDFTAHACFAQMSRVFEFARKRKRLIAFNPCDGLSDDERPVVPKTNRKPLEKADLKGLVQTVLSQEPDAYKLGVLLAACNGLRLGECLGLSWEHVVFDGIPHLVIEQQYTHSDGLHQAKADERHVTPLDDVTVKYLQRWRSVQRGKLNSLGLEPGLDTPLLTSEKGTRIDTHNFESWWRKWCVRNGYGHWEDDDGRTIVDLQAGQDPALYDGCIIEWHDATGWPCDEKGRRYSRTYKRGTPKSKRHYKGLTFHTLRHTWATHRLDAGANLKTVQALGGWASPDMLMNIYGHSLDESVLNAGGYMDALLADMSS